jgi:hypothetical protein
MKDFEIVLKKTSSLPFPVVISSFLKIYIKTPCFIHTFFKYSLLGVTALLLDWKVTNKIVKRSRRLPLEMGAALCGLVLQGFSLPESARMKQRSPPLYCFILTVGPQAR